METAELYEACAHTVFTMAIARATDPWYEATRQDWDTDLEDLEAIVRLLPVALGMDEGALAGAACEAQGAAATSEAMGEAVVPAHLIRAATRRGDWAEGGLVLLERLMEECCNVSLFFQELQQRFRAIKPYLEGTEQASPNVPVALVAKVAEFEQLWDASARLAKDHLLGILEVIDNILLNPYGGPGGPGGHSGPGSRAVAEQCHKAIKDIPRLLQRQ